MELAWFSASNEVKQLLILAAEDWEQPEAGEYVQRAIALSQDNPDVLIAAYRYFFYKNNPVMALRIADQVMQQVRTTEALPENWEQLQLVLRSRKEDAPIRLYLNAYASTGYLFARLGDLEKAREITERIHALDDRREFGATTVLEVLNHPEDDDD